MRMSDKFDLPLTVFTPEHGTGCVFDAALVKVDKCGLHLEVYNSDCGVDDAMSAIVTAVNSHDKLIEALKTTANELNSYILAENKRLKSSIRCTDMQPPDYHDQQTVHEAFKLIAELEK